MSRTLNTNLYKFTSVLSKSQSKYVRLASDAIKAAKIVSDMWKIINVGIQVQNIVLAVAGVFGESSKTESSSSTARRPLKANIIADRVNGLNGLIKSKIIAKISEQVAVLVRQMVGLVVSSMINAAVSMTSSLLEKATGKGRNPLERGKEQQSGKSQLLRDLEGGNGEQGGEQESQAKRDKLQNDIIDPHENLPKNDQVFDFSLI